MRGFPDQRLNPGEIDPYAPIRRSRTPPSVLSRDILAPDHPQATPIRQPRNMTVMSTQFEHDATSYGTITSVETTNASYLRLDASACASLDHYALYRQVVGDTDGGVLLSEEDYAKRLVAAAAKAQVATVLVGPDGLECRRLGPTSRCFCGHRYRDHSNTDPSSLTLPPCRVAGCRCRCYSYLPSDVRCTSCAPGRHLASEHDAGTHRCDRQGCRCGGFTTGAACECGQPLGMHKVRVDRVEQSQPALTYEMAREIAAGRVGAGVGGMMLIGGAGR